MNSSLILNRFAIALYAALTSIMSGIDQLRARVPNIAALPQPHVGEDETGAVQDIEQIPQERTSRRWRTFQETLTSLLLWGVLGFAAGFLIGMIRPW